MDFSYLVTRTLFFTALILSASYPVYSNTDITDPTINKKTPWQKLKNNIALTWNAPDNELYIPLNAWHNRWAYDKEKISNYNERAWGIGYGKYRYDQNDNWHALYAMIFMDSHTKPQPIVGYSYQKMWIPKKRNQWRFGIGFTASITARHEYHYLPLPLALPLFSIEYNRIVLQSTYLPSPYNEGNVLFTWIRWQF